MKSIDTIISLGAMFYRVKRSVLTSPTRGAHTVKVRNSIIGVCRSEGHTLQEIADAFFRDHGSIHNSLKNVCPQRMGEFWDRHQGFVEVTNSAKDDDGLVEWIDTMISELDSKIVALNQMRSVFVKIQNRLRK